MREIEHAWIPLRDGCRLAARMWLPESAARSPVPAVVEYIPYGKRVGTRERDETMHAWFAGHGLAALRIDLRGSGESSGVLLDEYLPQEQEDGADAIAWVAAQPWCSGSVGLIGKSWGGFNALQIAARRPPALRGIVTVCSTDDRYADDVHYMGGCLLNDNLWWGGVFFQLCAQPPDPELVGAEWRSLWQDRLAAAHPHPLRWLEHPLRDDYWRQGSVCENYAAIECPVYAVGGWADAYSNAIPRMLAGLSARRSGLIGPWGHAYPHEGAPGPAIGFLQDALAWWNGCLRGGPEGAAGRPFYRVWMPERAPTGEDGDCPGRWVAEAAGRPIASSRAFSTWRAIASARPALPRGSRSARRRPRAAPRAAGSWRRRATSATTMPTRCVSTRSRFASAPSCWARPSCGSSSRVISRRIRGGAPVRRRTRRLVSARLLRTLEPHPRARPRGVGAARARPAQRGQVPLE